ncbi:hypothetical protein TIFTF001_039674 [Ficus carica]|uniref:Uncharacterized protein n=1 Tax=Ficus carica TaxID=3494 RepID=A0AA88E9K6_FICCA|nr:hypothetical protein TIFTF001_039674 [Ficus carica]
MPPLSISPLKFFSWLHSPTASSTTHAASCILRWIHQGTYTAFPLSLAALHPYSRSTSRLLSWEYSIRNGQNPSPTFSVIVHCGCVLD